MREVRRDGLDRILGEASSPSGPCPDANALAGLAEGTLGDAEREAILDHVSACALCRRVTGALLDDDAAAPSIARRSLASRPAAWAVAATLLVGVAAYALFGRGREEPPQDTAEHLASAASRLARDVPGAFAGFEPLSRAELEREVGETLRGARTWASPAGRILDTRSTFAWEPIAGARNYTVTLLGRAGLVWRRSTPDTRLAWPDGAALLERDGRYVWTLAADDLGATQMERSLAVVSAEEAAAWRVAVAAVEARIETPLRALVLAHLALRRDLPAEAEGHARRYVESVPRDPLGAATLAHVRARLAAP